jgi:hypothetical protein
MAPGSGSVSPGSVSVRATTSVSTASKILQNFTGLDEIFTHALNNGYTRDNVYNILTEISFIANFYKNDKTSFATSITPDQVYQNFRSRNPSRGLLVGDLTRKIVLLCFNNYKAMGTVSSLQSTTTKASTTTSKPSTTRRGGGAKTRRSKRHGS